IDNIGFSYPGGDPVLKGINIEIREGEKTALIGPNGSGKTTLFLICCGILKSGTGSIRVNGKEIQFKKFNPEISYLFQSPDDQLFSSTIFEDVAFGPMNMGMKKDDVREIALQALERVDSSDLADKAPFHLSGGEKRMAGIASLLSMNPKVLLFDEPTANLDSRNKRKVIELIQSMTETLFISSHNLEFLLETCTRVIVIDEGQIVADGPIKKIMSHEKLMNDHGLEKPHSLVPHQVKHHHT
ncbi:MAG: ABC transporter ATP-binding protein, partial [Spirochaetaceae bacterium]|nr:ABC transporter ATP-binding protein [Spirochaetaceae bacterium]